MINSKTSKKNFNSTYCYSFKKITILNMIDFIKYFFRIKKINFLLTFLSLLNFGIMFGAEEDKEEHKIKIKFEKRDKVEKEPFKMFLENFCKTFDLNINDLNVEDFKNSKYDFDFYYKDLDKDKIFVSTDYDFGIFYNCSDFYENVSTTRHLFFEKKENNEEKDNNITKVYDNIIENEKFKNISITVYINKDLKANNEEEKKMKKKKKKILKQILEKNNHIEKNLDWNGDKNNNGDVNKNKNNDCPCCNCCLDCFNHC